MNVHEFRKIMPCILCGRLGIHQPSDAIGDVPIVICVHGQGVPRRDRRYVHPRCYVRKMGIANLLSLPNEELQHIRLCDVSRRTMKRILDVKP